jgi:hypothetical protein
MRPLYSRGRRVRQDVLEIMKRWHRGDHPTPEAIEMIDRRIEDEIHEAVQAAISEIRRDDE